MTIEKLTDEERAALRSQREWPDLEDIDKALRIIDQLTEALAAATRNELRLADPDRLRQALLDAGLHVVMPEDMAKIALVNDPLRLLAQLSGELEGKGLRIATRAEVAVLKACSSLDLSPAKLDEDGLTSSEIESLVDAELARREVEP